MMQKDKLGGVYNTFLTLKVEFIHTDKYIYVESMVIQTS